MKKIFYRCVLSACALVVCAACAPNDAQTFSATLPPLVVTAPIYTITPTFTPSMTFTLTSAPTSTLTPSATLSAPASDTASPIATLAPTATLSSSATLSPTITLTPSPGPTQPLYTLTPVSQANMPPAVDPGDAPLSANSGWTCDDFPCEDDLAGWMQRIQVPPGFHVEHVGQFPGQPMQIAYGPDGRLYATVLENGTQNGAVYVLDASGKATRYSGEMISPLGLAFQPGTDVLYVSARVTLAQGAGIWRIPAGGGDPHPVITDLPCCMRLIDNQANGMTFGQDGGLYIGVGSLSDTSANPPHSARAWKILDPHEASILRIDPLTGEEKVYANGIRNPYDVTMDSAGQVYATDNGLLTGEGGDRVLKVDQGASYGWPYWREFVNCLNCPIKPANIHVSPDMLDFKPFTLPRGLVAYEGTQFPANMFDNVFVTLWNKTDDGGGQRVIRIDPSKVGKSGYAPEAFVTGLIRPIDVTVAPDGSLVVVDSIYGHVVACGVSALGRNWLKF